MGYAPPLIRPPLPPLRPPAAPPYRPPVLAPPPTQIDPEYEPPTLLPPTDIDLKGIICIYSNAPIWEPKKIRYRYPGESWQEIAGESYSTQFIKSLPSYFSQWLIFDMVLRVKVYQGTKDCKDKTFEYTYNNLIVPSTQLSGKLLSISPPVPVGSFLGGNITWRIRYFWQTTSGAIQNQLASNINRHSCVENSSSNQVVFFDYKVRDLNTNQEINLDKCEFKVFNIFNQEILSITRDDCPEVIVVPEKCYFKDENEKLVKKVNIGFFQNLEIEYNGNCATVLLKSYPLPLPAEIYKECSDNPNCPPPRIRFDQKCEEKCEHCPPGTAIKVLLGTRIACVDAVGCVLKSVKYKPGCNNYDCICI